jgi:thiamine-phosphate pyrophosphorylase
VLPPLYAIVDAEVSRGSGWSVAELARACLRGGARLVQLRAKPAGSAELLSLARQLVRDARAFDARVIVNDRADVAVLAGAAGVHVGQEDLRVAEVRAAFPAIRLVGLSTHTTSQVDASAAEAASYVAVGPVYGTATKETGYAAVGLDLIRYALARTARPLVAIGGITLERAPEVLAAGATSVAVISDLLATGDPESRVRAYLDALGCDARG